MTALKERKAVDLSGVVVTGDVFLDALPVIPQESLDARIPSSESALIILWS